MANKQRLIDANALDFKPDEDGIANGIWIGGRSGGRTMATVLQCVKRMIDNAPTVDAVPVVHGEWVVCGDGEYVPFMCSACGKTTSWYHAQTANYCPNCGAKMDGGTNE